MTVKEYTNICIKFAEDTAEWFALDNYKFYTTSIFGWKESCDNAHGGIDISWAFHMDGMEIRERAPQEFINELVMFIANSCDIGEDELKYIEKYYQ